MYQEDNDGYINAYKPNYLPAPAPNGKYLWFSYHVLGQYAGINGWGIDSYFQSQAMKNSYAGSILECPATTYRFAGKELADASTHYAYNAMDKGLGPDGGGSQYFLPHLKMTRVSPDTGIMADGAYSSALCPGAWGSNGWYAFPSMPLSWPHQASVNFLIADGSVINRPRTSLANAGVPGRPTGAADPLMTRAKD